MFQSLALLILFFVTSLVTGGAVCTLARKGKSGSSPSADLFIAFSLGFMVNWFVPSFLAGLLGLLFRFEMSRIFVVGVAVVLSGSLTAAAYRFRRVSPLTFRAPGHDCVFLGLLGAVFLAFLVSFDSHVLWQDSCLMRAAVIPFNNYLTAETPMTFTPEFVLVKNGWLVWDSGQRLGPTFMVAPFLAWFKYPGLRILHALCGTVAAGYSYLAATHLFGKRWIAVVTGAAVALNPFILSIPIVDENILALAPVAAAVYFSLRGVHPAWMAGAMFGLALGTRHVLIVALPALALPYLFRGRLRALGSLGIGLLAASLPWIVLHVAMYFGRTGNLYESFGSSPPVQYELMGHAFSLRALLSWPFTEEVVRSPFNGFPTLLSFPLTMLRTWGVVLSGVGILGLVWSTRRLVVRLIMVAWVVPFMAVLMIQSGWTEPNKMGLFLDVSLPLTLLAGAGFASLVPERKGAVGPVKWGLALVPAAVLVVIVGMLTVFQVNAGNEEYPVDRRMYDLPGDIDARFIPGAEHISREQELDYAEVDRKALSALHLFPDYSLAFPVAHPGTVLYRAGQALFELANPGFRDRYSFFKDVPLMMMDMPLTEEWLETMQRQKQEGGLAPKGYMPDGATLGAGPLGPPSDKPGLFPEMEPGAEPEAKWSLMAERLAREGSDVLPISMILHQPLDKIEGEPELFSCDLPDDGEKTAVRIDVSRLPVNNPGLVSPAGTVTGALSLSPGRALAVTGLQPAKGTGGHFSFLAYASPQGALFIIFHRGQGSVRGGEDNLCHFTVHDAGGASSVVVLVPSNQPLYVRETVRHDPRAHIGWLGYVSDDGVTLSEPFRTSN